MIYSFKGRKIDRKRPVEIYRNLNGGKHHRWSIRQDGLVVAHAERVEIREVSFVVREAGYRRAVREKRRNVHAWARGYVCPIPTEYSRLYYNWCRVIYALGGFYQKHHNRWRVTGADYASFHEHGMDVVYPMTGPGYLP